MRPHADTSTPRPDLESIGQFLESVGRLAEELFRAVRSLPRVEADGSSECPFAGELHARKEKLQQELQSRFGTLHSYREFVRSEIARCKNNLVVLRARGDMLHGDRARAEYSQAEVDASAYYERCVKMRDRIEEMVGFVQGILRAASSKQLPPGRGSTGGDQEAPSGPRAGGLGSDDELEKLFDLDSRAMRGGPPGRGSQTRGTQHRGGP